MIILGVDPGLKATGYGFISYEGQQIRLVEAGTIEPKQKDVIPKRINNVYNNLDKLLGQYQPGVMILEKLYAHYKHPATAFVLGHVRGVICLLCARRNIKLVEYSVKRIRKAITGNGNASKLQTQRVVGHILRINASELTLDASDALALALGYVHIIRYQLGE